MPHAIPGPLTAVLALATVAALLVWRVGPLAVMAAGGAIGVAQRFCSRTS